MAALKSVFQRCSLEEPLSYGQTAVFYAQRMSEEMMRWLVEQGADINAVNKWGETSLHNIISNLAFEGQLQTVDLLIRLGADIHVVTPDGDTPLHYAAKWGHLSIVEKLAQTEEALQCLLEIFDVPAPSPKRFYDGKAKIIAAPGSWQEQFEELYPWILTPPLTEKAGTVQGELLRISASVCSLILDGFVTDWAEFRTRVKLYSILHFLHRGNPLLREEIRVFRWTSGFQAASNRRAK